MRVLLSGLGLLPSLLWSSILAAASQNPFPLFEGKVWVPVGNHGSTTAEITGPSELTTTDGYGPHKEVIRFDWMTGQIARTDFDANPNPTVKDKTFANPAEGGAFLPYRRQLEEISTHIVWIQQHLYYLNKDEEQKRAPEMQAVLSYLKAELDLLDTNAPDAIDVSNVPMNFRKGASHTVAIETLTKLRRELLVRLLDASGQELKSWRSEVRPGHQTTDFSVSVPETVTVDSAGILVASLVPIGANADQSSATHSTAIKFTRTEQILNANAYWVGYNEKPSIALYASYYCPNACELRAEIYGDNGQVLASTQLKAEKPVVNDGIQYSSFEVDASSPEFQNGKQYSFSIKLLPEGASSEQFFTEITGQFTAGT